MPYRIPKHPRARARYYKQRAKGPVTKHYKIMPAKRKRKRSGSTSKKTNSSGQVTTTSKRFRKGYDRTGGYYGRFRSLGGELKFHDLDIDDTTIASGDTVVQDSCLTIAQGTSESERDGRKIVVRRIGWKYMIELKEASDVTQSNDVVRVFLVLDKQTNGAALTSDALLNDPSGDIFCFRNIENSSRFKVLYHKTHVLNTRAGYGNGTTNETAQWNEYEEVYLDNLMIPIEYDSTTGAVTEMRTNNIAVILIGLNGLATFSSRMRVRFLG